MRFKLVNRAFFQTDRDPYINVFIVVEVSVLSAAGYVDFMWVDH